MVAISLALKISTKFWDLYINKIKGILFSNEEKRILTFLLLKNKCNIYFQNISNSRYDTWKFLMIDNLNVNIILNLI